jgi:hypothetical protein
MRQDATPASSLSLIILAFSINKTILITGLSPVLPLIWLAITTKSRFRLSVIYTLVRLTRKQGIYLWRQTNYYNNKNYFEFTSC